MSNLFVTKPLHRQIENSRRRDILGVMRGTGHAKWVGISAICAMAGVFIYWIWPVHFGLSKTDESPFNISSLTGFAPINPPTEPLKDYQFHSVCCHVYANVPDIQKLLPADNPHGPISLTREQFNGIVSQLPPPQTQWIDLTPLNHLNPMIETMSRNTPTFNAIWLNSEMRSWVECMNFVAWSETHHRFFDYSQALYRNINPYVEGKIEDSRITLRLTLISRGNRSVFIPPADIPPGVSHRGLGRYEMDYGIGEFPVDQDSIHAFKVKAERDDVQKSNASLNSFTNNALVIFEIHPPNP